MRDARCVTVVPLNESVRGTARSPIRAHNLRNVLPKQQHGGQLHQCKVAKDLHACVMGAHPSFSHQFCQHCGYRSQTL